MLEIRPSCENCDKALPPNSTEAMICSFECTFCRSCALDLLENVCPNCGGGLSERPIRPATDLKNGNCIENYPASEKRIYKPVDMEDHKQLIGKVAGALPHDR